MNNRALLATRIQDRLDRIGQTAPTPPAHILAAPPTAQTVRAYPGYYICGPGRAVAEATDCSHGYRLTDSCPAC